MKHKFTPWQRICLLTLAAWLFLAAGYLINNISLAVLAVVCSLVAFMRVVRKIKTKEGF
jgi:hypothetical protein